MGGYIGGLLLGLFRGDSRCLDYSSCKGNTWQMLSKFMSSFGSPISYDLFEGTSKGP